MLSKAITSHRQNIPCETCPLKPVSGPVLLQEVDGRDESLMPSSYKPCGLSAANERSSDV